MSENNPQDAASEIFQATVRKGLEDLDATAALINASAAARRRRIPEPFFVDVLLPHVRKWVRCDPTAEPGFWLNVADGLNAEIDVVDSEGNVVVVVPPPFHDIAPSSSRPQGRVVTPAQIVDQQRALQENGDTRAVMNIEKGLIDILEPRPEDELKIKYIRYYIAIYQRYELPMEELLGPNWRDVIANSPSVQEPSLPKGTQEDGSAEEDLVY